MARQPAALGHGEAAAVPMAGLTAHQFLVEHLRLGPGGTVLVNGAAGGVGHFCVQLAEIAGASQVIAVASGRHEAFLKDLGRTGSSTTPGSRPRTSYGTWTY
ncbi:hypothetical protein ACFV0D_02390 [Streptomyces sp. NPDC059556]|uniref:hypothetical protein n=1 Tax=Streptomyces sp. NPDC059556 TaxID=3346863 RepID=UPI0036781220